MEKEISTSYALQCVGVADKTLAPLKEQPAGVSVTVYLDGSREVGCAYLRDGLCFASYMDARDAARPVCIHLHPQETPEKVNSAKSTWEMVDQLGFTPSSRFVVRRLVRDGRPEGRKYLLVERDREYEQANPSDMYRLTNVLRDKFPKQETRIMNVLLKMGFRYIEELKAAEREDIFEIAARRSIHIKGFGKVTRWSLREALELIPD